jgi:hypothetical protein
MGHQKTPRPLVAWLTAAWLILFFQNCSAPFLAGTSLNSTSLIGSQASPTPQPSPGCNAGETLNNNACVPTSTLLSIRLGRRLVVRGPAGDELDTVTTLLQKSDGTCASAGYTRLRTAGWLYSSPQVNTLPLYRCYNSSTQFHFASNTASCEGLGTMEFILGYVLAQ